jgi:DNA-binding transcriptional regulator YdaS (Cro superfamily)
MENTFVPQFRDEHPLDLAARMVRGRNHLAKLLRVSPAAIGNWKKRDVPVEQCIEIERHTSGIVRCELLRPDVNWAVIRGTQQAAPSDSQLHPDQKPAQSTPGVPWLGVERRRVTDQAQAPANARREIDRPNGFPAIEGV